MQSLLHGPFAHATQAERLPAEHPELVARERAPRPRLQTMRRIVRAVRPLRRARPAPHTPRMEVES